MLAFQMWSKSKSSEVRKGIDYITKNTEFEWGKETGNLYYHYYNAQAMINQGGKEWSWYNSMVRDELLKNQASDGSWPMGQKIKHGAVNQHMKTEALVVSQYVDACEIGLRLATATEAPA